MVTKTVDEATLDAKADPGVATTFVDNGTAADTQHNLVGDKGDDTFISGPGVNTFDGGAGQDTVDYSHSRSGVTVDLTAGQGFSDDGKITDVLFSVENVRGSHFADHLTGAAGGSHIDGGWGGDVMTGGEGGPNTFSYETRLDSFAAKGHMDEITNFHDGKGGDVIDLSKLDQSMGLTGKLVNGAVQNAGDVSVAVENGNTFITERVDADPTHDVRIELDGSHQLTPDNFHM